MVVILWRFNFFDHYQCYRCRDYDWFGLHGCICKIKTTKKFLDVLKWFQPSLISMSRCSLVLPIVMNPVLAIPFILTPGFILYHPVFSDLFWTDAYVWCRSSSVDLSSNYFRIIIGGWKTALLQTLFWLCFFVYYPFIKQMDKQALHCIQETSDLERRRLVRGIKMDEKVLEVVFHYHLCRNSKIYVHQCYSLAKAELNSSRLKIKN